jgi:Glycosyl hydrolase family 3 N terminal domain
VAALFGCRLSVTSVSELPCCRHFAGKEPYERAAVTEQVRNDILVSDILFQFLRRSARVKRTGRSSGRKSENKKAAKLPYKNASLPSAKRVKDLLSRMTLEEKAAQMLCIWMQKAQTLVDADGNFDLQKAQTAFKKGHGLGQVGRPSDAGKGKDARGMAELTNAIQKFFIENSRLGIPVIFHEECLHGHAAFRSPSRWEARLIPIWSKHSSP